MASSSTPTTAVSKRGQALSRLADRLSAHIDELVASSGVSSYRQQPDDPGVKHAVATCTGTLATLVTISEILQTRLTTMGDMLPVLADRSEETEAAVATMLDGVGDDTALGQPRSTSDLV